MFKAGDEVLGKYRIIRPLTPGAFGSVYVVQNYGINRTSVVKAVATDAPQQFRELIEAYSQNLCGHPHIVPIYASEIANLQGPSGTTSPYVVMELEYLPEGSFDDRLSGGYTPIQWSVSVVIDTLHALQFSHAKNIIHGDVKPNNIFVGSNGAKLADFGLSKNANLRGSPRAKDQFYLTHGAPELFSGEDIDSQTDIFAAGITLFRAVNNVRNWNTEVAGVTNSRQILIEGRLVEALGYQPEVPTALRKIINRACSPDRSKRFATCTQFRQALDKLHFRSAWRKIDANTWTSEYLNRDEKITISRSASYRVDYSLNGRKVSKHCRSFPTYRESTAYLSSFIKDNTLE